MIGLDTSVSLGNVIDVCVSLGAVTLATWRIVHKLTILEVKLNLIWAWYKKQHRISDNGGDH